MAIGWNKLHHLKPPVDIELLMQIWPTLKIFNLIWNPSPYIICSIIIYYFYGKLHCFYSITQCIGWYLSLTIYVCIYKTNGVTSTCTQNKSHTTHLQIPPLTSVCKNIYNQYNIMIFIVHIYVYMYMYMYIILIILIILIQLSEVSHIRHVLTLINTYGKWYSIILTNL